MGYGTTKEVQMKYQNNERIVQGIALASVAGALVALGIQAYILGGSAVTITVLGVCSAVIMYNALNPVKKEGGKQ